MACRTLRSTTCLAPGICFVLSSARRLRTGGGGNAEKVPDYRVGLSSAPAVGGGGGDGPNLLPKAMSATTADRKAGKNARRYSFKFSATNSVEGVGRARGQLD